MDLLGEVRAEDGDLLLWRSINHVDRVVGSGDVYLEDIVLDSRNAGGEEEKGDDSGSAVEGSSGATEVHR